MYRGVLAGSGSNGNSFQETRKGGGNEGQDFMEGRDSDQISREAGTGRGDAKLSSVGRCGLLDTHMIPHRGIADNS